ncbi:MAG TPA: twin-arginine translocation pathway signal protein [Actinomycetota bacterium]|nr:twin-arginine translocation pathway signal protein [Actinomycetota bacterium]
MDARRIPSCILTPRTDEGPYFVDERLLRSDIRGDAGHGPPEEGVRLVLELRAVEAGGDCPPVEGAHVDVWHCNAYGTYSDEPAEDTVGRTFLRGCQVTDADGGVRFTTIFPGWYPGRAVHVHLKVRLLRDEQVTYDFTTQLFFAEDVIHEIHTRRPPYEARGAPEMANAEDYIYRVDGPALTVPVAENDDGYRGSIVIGLDGLGGPAG